MTRSFRAAASVAALAFALGGLSACGERAEPTETAAVDATATTTTTTTEPMATDATATASTGAVMVGGAEMLPTANIVENASKSADHTTLVTAVTAAGLGETLSGAGPFTVFAPTNAAFAKLPAGTVETLVKPESKADLSKILTYHVVPGSLTAATLNDGQTLTTVQGGTLKVSKTAAGVTLTDSKGNTSTVTQADVMQSNGVVHVVDTVVMPS